MSSLGYVNLELALRRALSLDESVEINPEDRLGQIKGGIDWWDILYTFHNIGICQTKIREYMTPEGLTPLGRYAISENYHSRGAAPFFHRYLTIKDLVLIAQSASAESCSVQYAT